MGLMDILARYADPATAPQGEAQGHFDQVAQEADPAALAPGIAAAFRSDATAPFGQAVGTMFGRSDPQQQAGLLNQIVQALGTEAQSGMAGSILGRVLGSAPAGAAPPTITPSQASQLSPDEVTTLATQARSQDESVVDKLAGFYSQHPALVKTIGAAGLAVVLGQMGK